MQDGDPYRLDTPARHRDGAWLADRVHELLPCERAIHIRGLHYILVSAEVVKPDGSVYRNTDNDWGWVQGVTQTARWLGYVPFDRILDQRNAAPEVIEFERPKEPDPDVLPGYVSGVDQVDLAALAYEPPFPFAWFEAAQPYRISAVGEKSSLELVLAPLYQEWQASLYLPSGHPTDTMIYGMAAAAAADGRPMVALYFSDCDPSGWDMPRVLGRKLQALRDLKFPGLEFEVVPVALTPDQVREYGLPSTPLKDTERRADRWRERMGVEQTEIDALVALRPELLREIAQEAVEPYFDRTLASRLRDAERAWRKEATELVEVMTDSEKLTELQDRLRVAGDAFKAELEAIERGTVMTATVELPEVVVPEATLPERKREPLIDSRQSWVEQTQRLLKHKRYEPLN